MKNNKNKLSRKKLIKTGGTVQKEDVKLELKH